MLEELLVETIQKDGKKAKIYVDEDAFDPRADFDNLATFCFDHKRYRLGDGDVKTILAPWDLDDFKMRANRYYEHSSHRQDKFASLIERYVRMRFKSVAFTWVGMLDHSGITIYPSSHDHSGWDCGVLGFAFVSRESLVKMGVKEKDAHRQMIGELEIYDSFVRGDAYGYQVFDENGDVIDSCWGFYGMKDVEEEARDALEHATAQD